MVKGNTTGGKNYKKGKHTSVHIPYLERAPDQMYARVVKVLGNRNVQCYCNDNKLRICHIRGVMRNRVWINIGDLVLISCRELAKKEDRDSEKADIVAKYDNEHLHRLKGEPDINQRLFLQMETASDKIIKEITGKQNTLVGLPDDDDIGIEFDRGAETEDTSDKESSDSEKSIDVDDI